MLKQYSIMLPKKVLAGIDAINNIAEVVKEFSATDVLIVTDKGVYNAGLVDRPVQLLRDAGVRVEIINNVPPEPEANQVEELLKEARKLNCNMVAGIGGGSAMDTAKIIAALAQSTQSVKEILGTDLINKKGIPSLMIPTTAGTGSEVTPNSIVTVPEQALKIGIVSRFLMADAVILDPVLTIKLPPHITASTGIDALAHALECYISNKANPFSDTYAIEAIRLISSNIRRAYFDGEAMEARHNMLLASFYGGLCIASSGTTAVHALAYPLGGRYRIPHGVSNAMLLPYVMEFNKDVIIDKLAKAAIQMNVDTSRLTEEEAADRTIIELYSLIKDLNIPSNLKQFGIAEKDIDLLVTEASNVKRLLANNPKAMTKDDMTEIYKKLFK